ncbi:MAG: NAD(P)H-hydrate dehydratase [Balneolales bacterium]
MNNLLRHQHLLLATAEQSRETDRLTISSLGIPGDTLMETAGRGAARLITNDLPPQSSILFICGKGNNAGDALVAARILLNEGYQIGIYPIMGIEKFSTDAARNLKRLEMVSGKSLMEVTFWDEWPKIENYDLLVDAIFGTGLQRTVKTPVDDIIHRINRTPLPVWALDIPSGLHSDTGEVQGVAVHAEKTIQFGLRKLGCYLGSGPVYAGIREYVPLSFPEIFKRDIGIRLLDESIDPVKTLVLEREPDQINHDSQHSHASSQQINLTSQNRNGHHEDIKNVPLHKYNNGVVHVIGGSAGLTGAPLYTAHAAWSLGMGAVSLIHPAAWAQTMDHLAPQLIKIPIGNSGDKHFSKKDVNRVLNYLADRPGVTVIGPGIGRHENTRAFIRSIIKDSDGPLIIDADGLRALTVGDKLLSKRKQSDNVILTPHPGELAYLSGKPIHNDSQRLKYTRDLSSAMRCTVLAKGSPVFVHLSNPSQTLVTGYDNSVFSRAGFGDILAGHIAAFFSRTNDVVQSCENGLLHGYKKIIEIRNQGRLFPEPSDLL